MAFFTAGIGENSEEVRNVTCEKLKFLGVEIHAAKNAAPCTDQDISTRASKVRVFTIRAQEDWALAKECFTLKVVQ